jgi:serine/threonine protein kinase
LGDGLLLSFSSSQDAVRCAIRIQEATREKPDLQIRIGIHQGNIIQEGPDILGDGVNIASRLQQIAPKGGIALSDKVQQDISGYPEFEVISLGQHSLKGVARSMGIYCLSPFGLPEIPEYRLLRLTGQGAYGEVWLAQSLTGVYRAVKIVHRDQFEDAKPYEREFTGITEYEPVSRKHEGLIDLLHVGHGQDDSFFYYVMELADDQRAREEINPREYHPRTLQSELEARGKLSIGECLDVGSRLARGLAFLHDHNLLHRDVKPANIVYVDGHPKLADIGLVTTMDNASTLVGTMGYIPPEGPGKPSSDVYALGMVLYELSTGKDRADFPEIDVLDPELKGLNQACLKACSNDLSERFANAHAFADELDQLARGKSTPDSVSTSPQTSNLKMGALAAALIAILALVLYQKSGDSNGENGGKPEPAIGSPSGSAAKLDFTKGLVAYYPFNGNAKDESGHGNDGELIGANLTADRHGEQKRAMEFNAPEAHIRIRDKPELDLGSGNNQEKTILFWMHHSENPAGGFLAKMSGKTSLTRDYAVGWGPGNGIVWGTGPSREAGSSTVDDELSVPCRSANNLWSHIAVSYSYQSSGKSFKKVYFNGKLLHSGPRGNGKLPANQADLIMGRGWRGKMDDVRIYNRALEDDEVALVYSTEKPRQPQGPTQPPLRLPASPSPNLFMPVGLVAYYPFDGNSRDESKEGNHLDVYGATLSSDRFGKAKSAYRFDGKDDFAVAYDSDSLDMGTKAEGWAVSCWINPQQGEEEGSYYIINKSWHTGSPGVDYGLTQVSGPTGQSYRLGISTASRDPGGWAAAPVPEGISHKGWRHIVATVDASQKVKSVYVNGRRIASINYQHKNPANNHALRVGSGNGRHYWKGDLDDIRIYNRALSAKEVKALYALEKSTAMPTKRTTELFENSLGMQFVPVSGTGVLFSIWETRVKDYAAYAATNKGVNAKWKNPGYIQGDTHPAGYVNWNDAQAFCAWLTRKELVAGKLKPGQRYRLPTDAEWSVAIGLTNEQGDTPEEKRDMGIKGVHPWGKVWPPPKGFGNYKSTLRMDNFEATSPVGSFAANQHGIYDLGGNVWEWCEEWYNPAAKQYRVQRGASWGNDSLAVLLSSYRNRGTQWFYRDSYGFRCVLTDGSGR